MIPQSATVQLLENRLILADILRVSMGKKQSAFPGSSREMKERDFLTSWRFGEIETCEVGVVGRVRGDEDESVGEKYRDHQKDQVDRSDGDERPFPTPSADKYPFPVQGQVAFSSSE